MSSEHNNVEQVVRDFVDRVKPEAAGFASDAPLYAGGVGLDSLEAAELSAVLEDEFGSDPFSSDAMPQTLDDIVGFYDAVSAEA